MNTIQAILPLIRVFQCFCLSPVSVFENFQFSVSFIFKIYSILQITIRLSIFVHGVITNKLFIRKNEYQIVAVIDTVLICGVRLLEIIILTEAFLKRYMDIKFMENIQQIDDILKNRLHIAINCRNLYRNSLIAITIWIGTFVFIAATIAYLSYGTYFYFCLIYLPPFFVSSLTYFQIIIWINLIQNRFKMLRCFLNDLKYTNDTETDYMMIRPFQTLLANDFYNRKMNLNSDANIFSGFVIARDLYNRLWDQTNLVNERFQWSMVINIGNDFVSLLSNFYWMLICMLNYSICRDISIVGCFFWSLINILHIFTLCRMCNRTVNEAAGIAYAIHSIKCVINSTRLSSFVF